MPTYTLEIDSEWTLAAVANGTETITISEGTAFYHTIRDDEQRPLPDYQRFEYHGGADVISFGLTAGDRLWLATRSSPARTTMIRPADTGEAGEALQVAQEAQAGVAEIAPNVRKMTTDAVRAPLPTDDATQGYGVGSVWVYEGREYHAVAADTGKARWVLAVTINPLLFGAAGDETTDDAAALNRMFDYIRLTTSDVSFSRPVVIDGRNRVYMARDSINATLMQNYKGWAIRDLVISSEAYDKVAFDLSGSRWFTLENFHVWGRGQFTPTLRPWSGILLMRADGTQPASNFTLRNCSVDGYFRGVAMHNYASEVVTMTACNFWNRAEPSVQSNPVAPDYAPAYAAVIDGHGDIPHKSQFVAGVTGRWSATVNTYIGCTFQKPFGIQGYALYFSDFSSIKFIKPYITNGGPGAVIAWRVWSGSYQPYGIEFDGLQVETDGNKSVFDFKTGGIAATFPIIGLTVSFGNIFSTEDVFRTDAVAGGQIRFSDLRLSIRRWGGATGTTPTNGVFSPRGRFSLVGGEVQMPQIADLGTITEFAGFTPVTLDLSNGRREFWGRTYHRGGLTAYNSISTSGLPIYADNAAAKLGGLGNGDFYGTNAGELRFVRP